MSLVNQSSGDLSITNGTDDCSDQNPHSTDQSFYSKSDSISESESSLSLDGSLDDTSSAIVNSTRKDELNTNQPVCCKSDGNNNGTQLFHNTSLAIYNVSKSLTAVTSSKSQTVHINQICHPDPQQIKTQSLMLPPSVETSMYTMHTNSPHHPGSTIDIPNILPESGPVTESLSYLVNQNTINDRGCMTSKVSFEQSQSNMYNPLPPPPLQFNVHQIFDDSVANEFIAANALPVHEVQLIVQDSPTPGHQLSDLRSITSALSVLLSLDPSMVEQQPLPQPIVEMESSSPEILNSASCNPLTCEIPFSTQDPQLSADYDDEAETMHVCHFPDCGRVFDRSWKLKRHLTTHSDKNKFYCEHCNKGFICKDALTVHLQEHMSDEDSYTGKPQYMCEIPGCGQVFGYETNLKWHMDWHSDQENFFCAHCDKGFLSKNALTLHVKRHMERDEREKYFLSSMNHNVSEFCQATEDLPEESAENIEESSICIRTFSPAAEHFNLPGSKPSSKQTQSKTEFEEQDPVASAKPLQKLECTPGIDNYQIPEVEITLKEEPNDDITADFLLSEITKTFPCQFCNKKFARRYELRTHVNMHNKVPNPFHSDTPSLFTPGSEKLCKTTERCRCPNCCAEGDNKVRAPNGRLMHVCHISHCGKVFTGTDSLKRHLELHRSKKNDFSKYFCSFPNCNKVFNQPYHLKLHMVWHSTEKNFFCAHCNKGFTAKFQLIVHMRLHMDRKSKNCQGLKSKTDTGSKSSQPESMLQHICLMSGCGRAFNKIKALKAHLRVHSNEKKFICLDCNEAFPLKAQLVMHMKSHMNPKSGNFQDLHCKAGHVCHYCGRAYWQSVSLSRHIRDMHGDEEKRDNVVVESQEYRTMTTDKSTFVCHVAGCGRSFGKSWVLKRHQKEHSDEKNFICAYCGQGFARKVQLALHIRSHMNPKSRNFQGHDSVTKRKNESKRLTDKPQHACHIPNCARVFWEGWALKMHLRKFHSDQGNVEPTYICQVAGCGKAFSKAGQLQRHTQWHTSGRENFICDHCNKEFSRRDSIQMHMKVHKPDTIKHICPFAGCERVYYKISDLKKHLYFFSHTGKKFTQTNSLFENIELPKKPIHSACQCPNCSVEGGNKTRDSNGISLHICHHPDCRKVFDRPRNLKWHLVLHAEKENFVQPSSNKRFARKDSLEKNIQMPKNLKHKKLINVKTDSTVSRTSPKSKSESCQCPNCRVDGGNKTKDSKGRLLHICHYPNCAKVFYRPGNLKCHLEFHPDKKNLDSPKGNKGFVLKDTLVENFQMYKKLKQKKLKIVKRESKVSRTPTKPKYARCKSPNYSSDGDNKTMDSSGKVLHACHLPNCGKVFNRESNLKSHLEWHKGMVNYFCAHCPKAFVVKNALSRHVTVHTNEIFGPQYACSIPGCRRTYNTDWHLKKHLITHDDKKHYTCTQCGKRFAGKNNLKMHLKVHETPKKINLERELMIKLIKCEIPTRMLRL